MGLSERLAAYAVRVAHVLVVEVPGCWELRARTEQEVRRRGWRPASSPADADVLVVCGSPGPELRSVVDRLWDQLPGPRARVVLGEDGDPAPALDGAAEELRDLTRQRADARARQLTPEGGD